MASVDVEAGADCGAGSDGTEFAVLLDVIDANQDVVVGQRYGIIRFGSRADLYFPENVEIKSLLGQTMVGGETIIAKIN